MQQALSVADKADTGAIVGESTAIAAAHLTLWLGFLLSYLRHVREEKKKQTPQEHCSAVLQLCTETRRSKTKPLKVNAS